MSVGQFIDILFQANMYVGRQTDRQIYRRTDRQTDTPKPIVILLRSATKTPRQLLKMEADITEGQATSTLRTGHRGKICVLVYSIARRHASPDPI